MLGFALILFITVKNDIDQYRYLCFILIVIGLATSTFYFYTIKEVHMEREALILEALYQHAKKESQGKQVEVLPDNEEQMLFDMKSQ